MFMNIKKNVLVIILTTLMKLLELAVEHFQKTEEQK